MHNNPIEVIGLTWVVGNNQSWVETISVRKDNVRQSV